MRRTPGEAPPSYQHYQLIRQESDGADDDHPGNHDFGARELAGFHDDGPQPGLYPGHFSNHDHNPGKTQSEPHAGEDGRQRGRQHDAEELRRAAAAQHRRRLEQPRFDRTHAENGVHEDRIERAEKDQKESGAWSESKDDHRQRQPRGDWYGAENLDGRIEHLPDDRHAPDQPAERQRYDQGPREAAIDATDRSQQMDMEGLAIVIVIDTAKGEIAELEPDLVGWRDQAARSPHSREMPDCQQREWKGDRQQQWPQARPPGCDP